MTTLRGEGIRGDGGLMVILEKPQPRPLLRVIMGVKLVWFGQEALCDRTEADLPRGVQWKYAQLISGFLMRKVMLLGLLLLVMVVPVQAQDADYRLREPDVVEYLEAVPEIVDTWFSQIPSSYGKITQNPLIRSIVYEFENSYTYSEVFNQDFSVLMPAYDALSTQVFGISLSEWGTGMLRAWLRENPTDLAEIRRLEVPGYYITVNQIDFNNDGDNEFWLQISFDRYNGYLVLQRDSSQPGGYRFVETPLYWVDSETHYTIGNPTDLDVIHFGDMTGDDVPEWLVFTSSYTNFQDCGNLYVLSWRDDVLINLMPENARFCLPGEFAIENIDNDSQLEITQADEETDNWRCEWTITHRVGWNGTYFIRLEEQSTFPNTLGCTLRHAELLMWENRVAEAIPLYEAGIAHGWNVPTDDNPVYYAELERYAWMRLALAYALDGQMAESREILTELAVDTATSEAIDNTIEAVLNADTPLTMCVAAYNVWAEYELSAFSYRALPITVQIGREGYISGMMDDYPPEPEKAGCNAPLLIDALLEDHIFTTDEAPSTQLTALGIAVLDSFVADFNMDGADEWLIWPEAYVEPIFFVPDNDQYILSRPAVRHPNAYTHFGVQQLPTRDEQIFIDYAVFDFNASNVDYYTFDIDSVRCEDIVIREDRLSTGEVRLWRLQSDQFEQIHKAPVCQPRPLSELFSDDGRSLFAAAVTIQADESYNSVYDDVVYIWSPVDHTYVPPAPKALGPTETPSSFTLAPTDAQLLQRLGNAIYQLELGEPEAALTIIDDSLASYDPSVEQILIDGFHYYRALALEALDRHDEALAEYVAIYEAAPETAWGMLAALHFEVVDG